MPLSPSNYFFQQGLLPFSDDWETTILPITLAPNQTLPRGTVLGEQIGNNDVQTLTITGSPTGGTFTITSGSYTTAGIAFNATAAAVQSALLALPPFGVNAVQTLSLTGFTGGTFILSYQSQATPPLSFTSTASQVQTQLAALAGIGAGNVTVTGGPLNTSAITITFQGTLAGVYVPQLGLTTSLLVGAGTATQTVVNFGSAGANILASGGPLPGSVVTLSFQNALGNQAVATLTTTSTGLTGGTAPAAIVTHTTTGSAGTPGQYFAYSPNNTDGSQVAKCLLQFDSAVDANGNITFGSQTGGQAAGGFGQTFKQAPAFFRGMFRSQDLVGLDTNAINQMGRLLQGDLSAPNGAIIRLE
jgi:hypothetical protein